MHILLSFSVELQSLQLFHQLSMILNALTQLNHFLTTLDRFGIFGLWEPAIKSVAMTLGVSLHHLLQTHYLPIAALMILSSHTYPVYTKDEENMIDCRWQSYNVTKELYLYNFLMFQNSLGLLHCLIQHCFCKHLDLHLNLLVHSFPSSLLWNSIIVWLSWGFLHISLQLQELVASLSWGFLHGSSSATLLKLRTSCLRRSECRSGITSVIGSKEELFQ